MISSRTLLLFLIALNLLALAWWSGAMEPLIGSVREPGRLQSQIEPNSLELVLTPESEDSGRADVTSTRASGIIVQPQPVRVTDGPLAVASDSASRDTKSGSQSPAPEFEHWPAQDEVPGTPVSAGQTQQVTLSNPTAPLAPDSEMTDTDTQAEGTDNPPSVSNWDNLAAGPNVDSAAVTPDTVPSLEAYPLKTGNFGQDEVSLDDAQWQAKDGGETDGLPLISAALSGSARPYEAASDAGDAVIATACRQFLGLSYIASREVEADLASFGVRARLNRLDKGSFLVYIEPMPSLELARRKHNQLRRLGVRDLHIYRTGYYRHGISLGKLPNFERANRHKDSMSTLGVKTMRIGPVDVSSARYSLTVKAEPAIMDSVVMRHEVLAETGSESCES